jgi:hypothetical protein
LHELNTGTQQLVSGALRADIKWVEGLRWCDAVRYIHGRDHVLRSEESQHSSSDPQGNIMIHEHPHKKSILLAL